MGSTTGLAEPFKTRVEQLVAASGGKVYVVSGFRTRAQQIELRKKNGCPDVFNAPASACRVPTARPGESQHERGLAVDFGGDLDTAARLASQYGMRRTVPGEPWHFEPTSTAGMAPTDPSTGGPGERVIQGIAGLGGNLVEAAVEPLLDGLRKLTIYGLFLLGGVGLLAAGAYRGTTGRRFTGDIASTGANAAQLVATKKPPARAAARRSTRPRSAP